MTHVSLTRRTFLRGAAIAALGAGFAGGIRPARGQGDTPPGRIAFVRRGDIWVWEGGESTQLLSDGAASDPRWSPDGTLVLFVRNGNSFSDLMLYETTTGNTVQLTQNQSWAQEGSPDYVATSNWVIDPDWSPSGLIGFASDATADGSLILWLMDDPYGSPYPAASAQIEDHIEGVSLSVDGTLAAYAARTNDDIGRHTYVALRDLTDGIAYVLLDEPTGVYDPAIAPDSQRVAVAMRSAEGMSDIWLVERATGATTRVTTDAQATKPFWAPDGSWLGFLRMVDYRFEAWAVPIDGTSIGEPRRLFRFRNLDGTTRPDWTYS